jgi:hypothetical protein
LCSGITTVPHSEKTPEFPEHQNCADEGMRS